MAEDFLEMERTHRRQWEAFCRLLTWSVIGILITLALMAIFLL